VLFPTVDFAIFFLIVFLAHWLLNPHPLPWKIFMTVASFVFYAWWDWRFVWLLVLVTVLAQLGAFLVARTDDPRRRRWMTGLAVAALLAPLAWFKYYGFFAFSLANLWDTFGSSPPLPLLSIVLPVGISFYTFMAISYVVDVHRRRARPATWLDLFVYLSFFPHLVAGPIVRDTELIPQIRMRRDARRIDLGRAASLILGGLFKKVVIASFLASTIVDPVFGSPGTHSAIDVLVAIYAYAVVIYADFSAYADIAIGVALLLGFGFPANFDRPYTARSLQDFWRRWHMTLSRWLRDYLYIPLGGNRRGEVRTSVNIMLTMLIGGLWHGAGWTFIVWGALLGVGQVVGHRRRAARVAAGLSPMDDGPGAIRRQRFLTFQYVCLGWVFFRSDSIDTALTMLGRLVTGWGTPTEHVTVLVMAVVALMLAAQYAPPRPAELVRVRFSRLGPVLQGAASAIVLFAITMLGPQGVAPFIYFQF
jgi:D-alanyl-lipoteichoic acid acyltransferase DltB (MBOAT superfamily)